ncbi:MAG: pyruvate kinase [Verrucomicrobiales bacterium]
MAEAIDLKAGDHFEFHIESVGPTGDIPAVSVNYPGLPGDLDVGATVLVDSGLIRMRVLGKDEVRVRCEVLTPGKRSKRLSICRREGEPPGADFERRG